MVETDSLVSIEAGITTKRKQRHGEKFGEQGSPSELLEGLGGLTGFQ